MTSTLPHSSAYLNTTTTPSSAAASGISTMEKTSSHSATGTGSGTGTGTDMSHNNGSHGSHANNGEDGNTHVTKLRENDVLLGRGGGTNNHAGNVKFRKLVNEHKLRYLAASKVDKPKVAREVVQLWRQMNPPGRFLARTDEDKKEKATEENTIWYDVGDKKANAKASQCLRERTPEVMPYLRQLREQQDLSTEQGVMMVRQQQQQQAAAAAAGQVAVNVNSMGHSHPHHTHGHHPHAHQQAYGDVYGQAAPYSPMAQASSGVAGMLPHHHASPPSMSPHHARQHLTHSHMQGPSAAYSPRTAQTGGIMSPYNPMSPSPNSNTSPRHAPNAGQGPGAPPYGYPPAPPMADEVVDPMDPSVAAYYGDMTDLEYEQSMMIMQQQLEMQQMQLRRMQQQRAMQRAALTGTGAGPSPPGSSHPSGYEQSSRGNAEQQQGLPGGLTRKAGNFPQGPTANGGGAIASGTGAGAGPYGGSAPPAQGTPHNTRLPHQPPAKMTSPPNGSTTATAPREAPDANARKPKRTLSMTRPERTHSGLLNMNSPELPTTAEQDGELTLEEYRQQLEAYISNTKNEEGGGGSAHIDDGEASDLEDDWEKERDKHMQYAATTSRGARAGGVARTRSRGVDRAKSGASFMSIATNKSSGNMSMVSGFSNLSDLMSAASADNNNNINDAEKQPPKNRGVDRNQSNLSIMSELTDLSANIDNLSLYED